MTVPTGHRGLPTRTVSISEGLKMRKRTLAIVITGMALGIPAGIGLTATAAQATTPDQLCIVTPDVCMNNWNGVEADNNPVKYWDSGAIYNNWYTEDEGRVVGINCGGSGQPGCYPFTTGTGLNKRYNGDLVFSWDYQGGTGEPTGYCLDGGNYADGNDTGKVWTCLKGDSYQLNVFSDESFLVNVGASNLASSVTYDTPVWWGCNGGNSACKQGAATYLSTSQSDSQEFQLKGGA